MCMHYKSQKTAYEQRQTEKLAPGVGEELFQVICANWVSEGCQALSAMGKKGRSEKTAGTESLQKQIC